jgi:WD40 repeat protein
VTVGRATHEGEERVGSGPVVFVSYAREDAEWLRKISVMLKPEVRNRRMQLWSDTAIGTGRRWRPEIEDAIARADVALLLVSSDFLASDFIMDVELPALIKRGVPLVPVLLRPCRHGAVAELADWQWAHDPGVDGPIATSDNVEGAIAGVTDQLMALVDDRALSAHPAAGDEKTSRRPGAVSVPALAGSPDPGALDGVPDAPLGFVEREEIDELRAALLAGGQGAVAITGGGRLGLYGQGGIGKTVLAAALARDEELRRHFPDGVYWIALGECADLLGTQLDLLGRLGVSAVEPRTTLDAIKALEQVVADRRCLLVVDDVWTAAAAQAFDVTGPAGRVLYTTRDPATLRDVGADVHCIEVLSDIAARRLLAGLTNTPVRELPGDVDRVLAASGRIALALALVGAAVGRGGRDWGHVADELEQAGETFLAHPYADVFKAMRVAVATLNPKLAEAHEQLAVFPEDARVPVAAIARLWAHTQGASPEQAREWVRELGSRELLTVEDDRIVLHDLQRDFLLLRVRSLRLLHHELLQAYRTLLSSPRSPWRELPPDEPYILEHLIWHLVGAGDTRAATATVTDLGYLAIRAFRDGPHAAERDVRSAAAIAPQDYAIEWVLELLTRWGHLLADHHRMSDLAATLLARIVTPPPGVDTDTLNALLPARTLAPRCGLPDAHQALRRVLEGHDAPVKGVSFSPDGATLASVGYDATIRLWDVAAATQIALLEGHSDAVTGVVFSPDGTTLASVSNDRSVRLWDVATAAQTGLLKGHSDRILAVAISPDGAMLASAGLEGSVRLWDVTDTKQTALLQGHTDWVRAVAFSPDGAMLASASRDKSVRLWDTDTATQTALLEGHSSWVDAVAFSPDGATLASAGLGGSVRLWDVVDATQTALLEDQIGWIGGVAFSPDGAALASGGSASVRLWDVTTATQTALLEGHSAGINAVAFSPDSATLASASNDGSVRLWDVTTATRTPQIEGHGDSINGVAFSPDGATLASASDDGSVRLWDVTAATQTALLQGHSDSVSAVAFSPHGTTLASAGWDGSVRLWDVTAATQTALLQGHSFWVLAVAFSPDGTTLASGNDDGSVQLRDVADATQIALLIDDSARLEDDSTGVNAVAFSPDGTTLASANNDAVQLWDVTAETQTGLLEGHSSWVTGVAFSPDGATLASADHDGSVQLWDVASAALLVCVRLGSPVRALALHDRELAVGVDRAIAYFRIVDRRRPDEHAGLQGSSHKDGHRA